MRQLIIAVLAFLAVLLVSFGANAQAEEKSQDSCSTTCDAEYEECINKPGSLFSRTQAQIDSAEACYVGCSRDEGDALDACQKRKYSCWQEILDRKNPDGTWQCMYAGSIEYIRPACKTEGEAKCDGPREECIENGGKAERDCSDRCSALESQQTPKASTPEFCREQKTACLAKAEACQVEALVEKAPAESDLAISENAKRLNEELKALFGEMEMGDVPPRPKVPEITGNTPYLFDNPLSTRDNRYFSFTADAKNHIIEYRGGNKITLEFPDGTTFVPETGDFVRVPVGTKLRTEMGLYQGVSPYDNIGKFGMSSLGITNVAGGSSITLGGGSVVELVPAMSGGSSNVKLNNGDVRIGTGGFGWGSDKPDLPTEIQFEGRQDVEISWDGTDFAVSYDRESGKIIAEIYDGTIKVAVGEKTYSLSSSYGGEIKRIEIGGNGAVEEKIALSGQEWREKQIEEPVEKPIEVEKKRIGLGPVMLAILVGLIVAGGLGGLWYRRIHGTWPLEARWKPVVVKLMKVCGLVINKLKGK